MNGKFVFLVVVVFFAAALADQPAIKKRVPGGGNREQHKVTVAHGATGGAFFVRLAEPLAKKRESESNEEQIARYLGSTSEFGVSSMDAQLQFARDGKTLTGTFSEYNQRHLGLPVFGAHIKFNFNNQRSIESVVGTIVKDIEFTESDIQAAGGKAPQAENVAVSHIASTHKLHAHLSSDVKSSLVVFRQGLTEGVKGTNHLAWEVHVDTDAKPKQAYKVFVDAQNMEVLLTISKVQGALKRQAYYANKDANYLQWEEGSTVPDITQVQTIAAKFKSMYDAFNRMFGYDNWNADNANNAMFGVYDAAMDSPNAYFEGAGTYYSAGLLVTDVIWHEWGHAYTQTRPGLIYNADSGALNEGYADIFAEALQILLKDPKVYSVRSSYACVDVTTSSSLRWVVGDSLNPNIFGTTKGLRDMWNPTCQSNPSAVNDQYFYCGEEDHSGVHTNSGVLNQAFALVADGGTHYGVKITGIGVLKALYIFVHAWEKYTTSSQTYILHATALKSACADLVANAVTPVDPLTNENTGSAISSSDCTAIASMIDAVNMEATRCGSGSGPTNRPEGGTTATPQPTGAPATAYIRSLVPPIGSEQSGVATTIFIDIPRSFFTSESPTIKFSSASGTKTFAGQIYIAETRGYVYGDVPSWGSLETVDVTVSFDAETYFGSAEFTYIALPANTDYDPKTANSNGGTQITVTTDNLEQYTECGFVIPDYYDEDVDCLACLFGDINYDNVVAGHYVDSTHLKCKAPPQWTLHDAPAAPSAWVSFDGQLYLNMGEVTYYDGGSTSGDESSSSAASSLESFLSWFF